MYEIVLQETWSTQIKTSRLMRQFNILKRSIAE